MEVNVCSSQVSPTVILYETVTPSVQAELWWSKTESGKGLLEALGRVSCAWWGCCITRSTFIAQSSSGSFKSCRARGVLGVERRRKRLVQEFTLTNSQDLLSVCYAPLGHFFRACAWSGGTCFNKLTFWTFTLKTGRIFFSYVVFASNFLHAQTKHAEKGKIQAQMAVQQMHRSQLQSSHQKHLVLHQHILSGWSKQLLGCTHCNSVQGQEHFKCLWKVKHNWNIVKG